MQVTSTERDISCFTTEPVLPHILQTFFIIAILMGIATKVGYLVESDKKNVCFILYHNIDKRLSQSRWCKLELFN